MNKVQKLVYVTLSDKVVERLCRDLCVVISPEELLLGIIENISLESLADMSLTYEQIRGIYSSSNQIKLSPKILATFEALLDIDPQGLDTEALDHVIRCNGNVWYVHKSDADPHPSSPHAHNYEKNLKLHLGNGQLYRRKDLVGVIGKKELLAIREKIKSIALPVLEIGN
jgi:hypothetical protein